MVVKRLFVILNFNQLESKYENSILDSWHYLFNWLIGSYRSFKVDILSGCSSFFL